MALYEYTNLWSLVPNHLRYNVNNWFKKGKGLEFNTNYYLTIYTIDGKLLEKAIPITISHSKDDLSLQNIVDILNSYWYLSMVIVFISEYDFMTERNINTLNTLKKYPVCGLQRHFLYFLHYYRALTFIYVYNYIILNIHYFTLITYALWKKTNK